jgi:capsular polysaccharide biosynthesis protein
MEQGSTQNADEINLYDLWTVMVRRKKLIIGLFLSSVIASLIISFLMPNIFRGEAVLIIPPFDIATSNITVKEIADFVGKIDDDKKSQILSKMSSAITDIKLKPLKDSRDKIAVIIEAKDIDDIPAALSDIIEYINNIALVKAKVNEEKERQLIRSRELSSVIAASNELLNIYGASLKKGSPAPSGFNPAELNKMIADVKVEKLMTDQALQRLRGGVDIAKQLYIGRTPVKPMIVMNVLLSSIISLFLGVFLSLWGVYLEHLKKIKKTQG